MLFKSKDATSSPEPREEDVKKNPEKVSLEVVTSITSQLTHSISKAGGLNGHTARRLKPRHIDLIAIGGSIGTALFVTIGIGLAKGGPGNLLIAFFIHAIVIYVSTITIGELVCYLPVDSPFITHAGRFVDPAFEFIAGYNFYIMVSIYIPFEITSLNNMIHFWRSDYSPAATFVPQIVVYLILNVFAVNYYGESEFILAIGKLILAIGLLFFTFISMVGGNPQHDAFGFRNFKGIDNAFPEYLGSGASAFWAAYNKAVFTEVAAEYLSQCAGEAENPRVVLPRAFKSIVYRLTVFYILGSLSVGVLVSRTSEEISTVSPYVIAMRNMGINFLPDIVNFLCITSTFSAGNSYMYCSSRALFSLAKKGFAPKLFTWTTNNGVPLAALGVATAFSCLSLMQLGTTGAVALNWMVNLCTGAQVLNYTFMMVTYLSFYRACKAQGLDRFSMPLQTWATKLQPWPAIFGLVTTSIIVIFIGAESFIPTFDSDSFLYYYLMVFVNIVLFVFWKFFKKTKFVKPEEADLYTGLAEIEAHERELYERKSKNDGQKEGKFARFMAWVF